jgi:hypothetical protein
VSRIRSGSAGRPGRPGSGVTGSAAVRPTGEVDVTWLDPAGIASRVLNTEEWT